MRRDEQQRRKRSQPDPLEERFIHLGAGYFLDRQSGRVLVI